MKDIIVPILRLNKYASPPEKVNNTLFKFFLDRNMDIYPEKNNVLPTGFYLKHVIFNLSPAFDFSKYKCISNTCILKDAEINLNVYCYKKDEKDLYFAKRLDTIEKNTCILFLNIISSSNEENYIFNIIDK